MTFNVNIPSIATASFQPDYTKSAEYAGFTFYHNLKEWYFIRSANDFDTYPDSVLQTNNLSDGFGFLIGNNNSHIYTGVAEVAQIARIQPDVNTGEIIALDIVDIKAVVQTDTGNSEDVILTGGYVEGNNVILLLTVSEDDGPNIANPKPYILVSTDNGGTWTLKAFTIVGDPLQMPVGMCRMNFYNNYYYVYIVRAYDTDETYIYISEQSATLTGAAVPERLQTIATSTFSTNRRHHINRQVVLIHNSVVFTNDDRGVLYRCLTNNESYSVSYPTSYPIPPFVVLSEVLAGDTYTQIKPIENAILNPTSPVYTKQNVLSGGATPTSNIFNYDRYILWNELSNDLGAGALNPESFVDFRPITGDVIILGAEDNYGVLSPFLRKGGLINGDPVTTKSLINIPYSRFDTGDLFWTGEIVNTPLPAGWSANTATSVWISNDADTEVIDYGTLDFDYALTLTVEVPEDLTLNGTGWVDDQVTDIIVNGTPTGTTFSGPGGGGSPFSVNLTRGVNTIIFQIRNLANPGPGNPTGLRVEWDEVPIDASSKFSSVYTDMLVDEADDRLYVLWDEWAWILELSTLEIIAFLDLHAEELPGGPFIVFTGVTDDVHSPLRWRWLKNFNDVYIYNMYHDDTYTDTNDKDFYMWVVDDTDPSYHTMFSGFTLAQGTISKLEYFYDGLGILHQTVLQINGGLNTTKVFRTSGLAAFNQLTSGEVTVGPITFANTYVDVQGRVYVTESDEPAYSSAANTLFVYENANFLDIDAGSYVIPIDGASNPMDLDQTPADEYFGKSRTYFEIPGDYTCKVIINSPEFRSEAFDVLSTTHGETIYTGAEFNWTPASESLNVAQVDLNNEWAYFLTDDSGTQRLVRSRAVFYPV